MAQRFPFPVAYLMSNWARWLHEGDDTGPKQPIGIIASLMASVPRDPDDEGYTPTKITPPIHQEAAKAVDAQVRGMSITCNRVAKWKWVKPWAKWPERQKDTKLRRDEFEICALHIEEAIKARLCSI